MSDLDQGVEKTNSENVASYIFGFEIVPRPQQFGGVVHGSK